MLSEADLWNASLSGAKLIGATLSGASLSESNLWNASLSGANLSGAKLSRSDLSRAILSEADLDYADLSYATLSDTDLTKAEIGGTHFDDIDLRQVNGLETLHYRGPSHISISTIYRSEGHIPENFLRNAGVPASFIEYMHSLVIKPIDYYTCFISYSSKDDAFATRLHADLQSKGVRCWFAPEDLKIGEKFWYRIDESIRLYDKLLVVVSEHSVNSTWVEREVMAALEKEQQQQGKLVLFPIRLDDAVMQTRLPWAADIRRSRHIGNFTRWKHHDDYQKALNRLLRDLKAGA